jgi:hypothetical protein
MELSTGGLSSPHGGGPDYPGTTELTQTSIAVGPWLRFTILRPLDGRVDLFGAFDAQYQRQSVTYRPDTSPGGGSASADGFSFRAGPGIRFWATPRIAVGYVTQLSMSNLSGPLLAVSPPSSTLGAATTDSSSTEVALVGRFQVLGVF